LLIATKTSIGLQLAHDIVVQYEKEIDVPAERARLTKDIEKYEKGIASAERQLGNEGSLPRPAKGLRV